MFKYIPGDTPTETFSIQKPEEGLIAFMPHIPAIPGKSCPAFDPCFHRAALIIKKELQDG